MKYLMGVDEGTTGCKAVLFNEEGKQIAVTSSEYPSYYPNPGWVEQDIEEIKSAVYTCIRETIQKSGVNPEHIVGISHSNQGITMVLLDENEQPVFDHTIGWQDLRYVDMLPELRQEVDLEEYYRISGMQFGTYNVPLIKIIFCGSMVPKDTTLMKAAPISCLWLGCLIMSGMNACLRFLA